jgi:hypothetical protein
MRLIGAAESIGAISQIMAIVADTFTISAVILCIVSAVCFYLFTRLKQVEKKVALMEGILLDLKTATQSSFFGFPPAPVAEVGDEDEEEEEDKPDAETTFFPTLPEDEGEPLEGVEELGTQEFTPTKTIAVESFPKFDESVAEETKSVQTVQVNKMDENTDLESLSVAELAAIAKERGISGAGKMRKGQLIAALKPAAAEVSAINASSSLIDSSSLMAAPL